MMATEMSYWAASAIPAPSAPVLDRDLRTDTIVIGAGFTGLNAARTLAEAGTDTVVLEAEAAGFGASGRNGGFVSTRFRLPYATMLREHGSDVTRRMYAIGHEAGDHVERVIAELGNPACGYGRYGALTCALNERSVQKLQAGQEWIQREFGESGLRMLSRAEMAEWTGSRRFVGGQLSTASAGLHPMNYARALAADLSRRGVLLFGGSPVLELRREPGGVIAVTPSGSVRARQAIIAVNAYGPNPERALTRRIVPLQSACIATDILPETLRARILPRGQLGFDSKRVLRWFRIVDGRMLFGGRGETGNGQPDAAYRRLRANMVELFPELADVTIAHRWAGYVGMTLDTLPHVGRLDEHVLFAMGYNGSGVALSSLLGAYAARMSRGEAIDLALLAAERFRAVPLYPLRVPAIRAATAYHQTMDAFGR